MVDSCESRDRIEHHQREPFFIWSQLDIDDWDLRPLRVAERDDDSEVAVDQMPRRVVDYHRADPTDSVQGILYAFMLVWGVDSPGGRVGYQGDW